MLPKNYQFVYEQAMDVMNGAEFSIAQKPGHSERIIEVPRAALWLKKFVTEPSCNIMDIGFTMSSLDWLGLLLHINGLDNCSVNAYDIVKPERVKTRYPKVWLEAILKVPVEIGDLRTMPMKEDYFDVVTCISTIEHIGFDEAEEDDDTTAFKRSKVMEDARLNRADDVDEKVLSQFNKALKPGGHVIVTVPMGQGGPVLTKDSLGLYTRFWEYEADSWKNLTTQPGFELVDERFYGLGENGIWYPATSPADLTEISSELKPHAYGCAFAVLRKI